MRRCKLLLAVAIATATFGALTSSAGARNLETSSQTIRSQFRELRFEALFVTANCQFTMEGSFHSRTIAKVAGALVGYITSARLGPCSTGAMTVLTATLPWHMRYGAFSGTLPSISELELQLIGAAFQVREVGGITCLVRSTAERWWRKALKFVGKAILHEAARAILRTGGECFGEALTVSSDEALVTVLNSSTSISVTLI